MRALSLRNAAIILAAGIGLSGCATYGQYGGLGVGVGYGDGGYGYDPYYGGGYYGGSYGYNSPYGSYGYNSPYRYSSYGSPYGWYDGFYYPGSGYYVYDSNRRPYRWTDRQQRYWTDRQRTSRSTDRRSGDNWQDFQGSRNGRNADYIARRNQTQVINSGTVGQRDRSDRREARSSESRGSLRDRVREIRREQNDNKND